ncbi:MAG: response regulator [Chthoniobacterales bacterium]|nr:response regulator [Chthoniobacterales bacterium]
MAAEIVGGAAANDFENRYARKDGSVIHMLWSAYWSDADKIMFAVGHDITERARHAAALNQAKEDADRANRAKSEFLSRMSHELRTPMNAILGFAQLLEMDALTSDQSEGVKHILRGGHHLLELINEILDLSRIEAGRMSLSLEPVQLEPVLRETLALVHPLAAERGVRLNSLPHCDAFILVDRQRLKQVLLNLLSNAIKYNRLNGSVTIRCEEENQHVRILISDTGAGIPANRLADLFTPFERLGAEQSTAEGTGLGLAVTKRFVEAMKGTITVESERGEGSTFAVEFARVKSPLENAELVDALAEAPPAVSAGEYTILYIEDNLSNLLLIKRVLQHRPGVKLLSANNGIRGIDLARETQPDIILLDLNLPDMAGRDVLLCLRADPQCAAIPIIVISADATRGQIDRLMRVGASDYLTKPLDVKQFLGTLDRGLREGELAALAS